MLLNDMPFAQPFIVRMHCGLERKFLNTYDALDFLENEWPVRAGTCYRLALDCCRAALSGTGSVLAARNALAEACLEAGFMPLDHQTALDTPAVRAA